MKDYLKPHRNAEAEKQLKSIILQIESLMDRQENMRIIENLLEEADKFVKAPGRILDLAVIEGYESWTDLDGLVCELTMEIPRLPYVSKEDFVSIVQYIRAVVESGRTPEDVPSDCWQNFYIDFFTLNFPNVEADSLFEKIFNDTPIDELVELVKPKEGLAHDGISPIHVPEEAGDEVFWFLWDYLVPPSGKARTAQGEVIRIAGRVQYEFLDNGCINWDEDFRKMLDAFLRYVQLGNGFQGDDFKSAEILVQLLKEHADMGCIDDQLTTVLCSCAVAWVKQNPEAIAPLEADYFR